MKTIEDIKLEAKVSEMIIAAFNDFADPGADVLAYSDLVDISEALAMNIIRTVKEQ